MPAAPVLQLPSDGTLRVNPKLPIVCVKDNIQPTSAPSNSNERQAATTLRWTEQWTEQWQTVPIIPTVSWMLEGDGTEGKMSRVVQYSHAAEVDWTGVSFTAGSSSTVAVVQIRMPVMSVWEPGTIQDVGPGDAFIRCTVMYQRQKLKVGLLPFDAALQHPGPNGPFGTIAGAHYQTLNITEELVDLLGWPFTIGDLESIGSDLRVHVDAFNGEDENLNELYVGLIELDVTFNSSGNVPRQAQYEIQVYDDAGLAPGDLVWKKTYDTSSNTVAIPPEALIDYAGQQLWWLAIVHDTTGTASAPSSAFDFTLMESGPACLIAEESSRRVLMACWHPAKWFDVTQWDISSQPNTWVATLDRTAEPLPDFDVVDLEILDLNRGLLTGFTKRTSITEVEGNPDSFWWDFDNSEGRAEGPGLYVRVTQKTLTVAPGAFRAQGIAAVLAIGFATEDIYGGDEMNLYFSGRLREDLSFDRDLRSVERGRFFSIPGNLTLSNEPAEPGAARPFYRMPAHRQPMSSGWLMQRRPMEMRLGGYARGEQVLWSQCDAIWKGVASWPVGRFLNDDEVKLDLAEDEDRGWGAEMATGTWTVSRLPHLQSRYEGRTRPQVHGLNSGGIYEIAVIDDRSTKEKLDPGEVLAATDLFYLDDDGLWVDFGSANWSWEASTGFILIDSGASATFQTHKDRVWGCEATGPGATTIGTLAEEFMEDRLGLTNVNSSSFANFSENAHLVLTQPTLVTEALSRLKAAGQFHIVRRPGNWWHAEPERSETVGDHPVVIDDFEILGAESGLAYTHMASLIRLRKHPGIGTLQSIEDRVSKPLYGYQVLQTFKRDITQIVDVMGWSGVAEDSLAAGQEEAAPRFTIKIGALGFATYPTARVILRMSDVLDPDGELAAALCIVEGQRPVGPDEVNLVVRFVRELDPGEHF